MSALAKEHGALNLAQGFPDFQCHPDLIDLVNQSMKKGLNQYAPLAGIPELRNAIASKTEALYSAKYDAEKEITVTAGATQAIFTAIAALIKEGDEVIAFTPAYDCYEPAVTLAGGKTVHIELKAPSFAIDWVELKRLVNRKTRMIIINTPHNPTGALITAEDFQQLEKLVSNTEILILSDEVYEHIVFDGVKHQSITQHPKLAERAIVVSSFGKTFHNTGWKMGYVLAPEIISSEIRKVHQFNVFAVNTPIQYALAEILEKKDLYLDLNNFYQKKRDFFIDAIKPSRFKVSPTPGTYFQLLDYSAISDKKDSEFADELTIKHKIASIPVSPFYPRETENKLLRFCFAKGEDTLQKAADIINSL